MHERVDLEPRNEPHDLGVADVGLDPLDALELPARPACVEAGHVLELGIGLEPLRQQRPEMAADAGDQDPAAGH